MTTTTRRTGADRFGDTPRPGLGRPARHARRWRACSAAARIGAMRTGRCRTRWSGCCAGRRCPPPPSRTTSRRPSCSCATRRSAPRWRRRFPAMPWIGESPVFLVFLGDARRMERIGELRGLPADNGILEGFFNAAVDAALAMQTFILAAESAGLGCCPISVLRNEAGRGRRGAGPAGQGVPRRRAVPRLAGRRGPCQHAPAGRGHAACRPLRRHRAATPVDGYDRAREARNPTPREKQRAPARFGYADSMAGPRTRRGNRRRARAPRSGPGCAPTASLFPKRAWRPLNAA